MEIISSIIVFLSSFDNAFYRNTAENIKVLFRGVVLANGPRTVTNCLTYAWPWAQKHWTAYENTLRTSLFNMLLLSKILFLTIVKLLPQKIPIHFLIDESLVRRYGPYVTGVRMHRDAVRSSHTNLVVTPGNKWVVLAVAIPLPFAQRYFALPILSLLYITRKQAKRNKTASPYRKHRTVGQLALTMIQAASKWCKNRRFWLIADGAYATHELADVINPGSKHPWLKKGVLISRFRLDGATYGQPKRKKGRGRPPVRGKKLPSPMEIAGKKATKWKKVTVSWYGKTRRKVKIISRIGLWYKCGYAPTMIRWVLVRDLDGEKPDEVFFSTDIRMKPEVIVEAYVRRWPLETTFQETREYLGLETLKNRTRTSIIRSVPMLLSVYSILVVWFLMKVRNHKKAIRQRPWYKKEDVTFSDILFAAREDIVSERINNTSGSCTGEFLFGNYGFYREKRRKRKIRRAA